MQPIDSSQLWISFSSISSLSLPIASRYGPLPALARARRPSVRSRASEVVCASMPLGSTTSRPRMATVGLSAIAVELVNTIRNNADSKVAIDRQLDESARVIGDLEAVVYTVPSAAERLV